MAGQFYGACLGALHRQRNALGLFQLRHHCTMNCGLRVKLNNIGVGLQADIARLDEIWSEGMARHDGPDPTGTHFTAADAFYAPVAFRVQTYGLKLSERARAYGELLLKHPAMQAWYEAALAEPWRDAGHEAEVQAAGEVTEDHRVQAVG